MNQSSRMYNGGTHKPFEASQTSVGAAYLMVEDFVERYNLDETCEKILKTQFRPTEVVRLLCDDIRLNGAKDASNQMREKMAEWKKRPARSRSNSPSGRTREILAHNILDSLRKIDAFCAKWQLAQTILPVASLGDS